MEFVRLREDGREKAQKGENMALRKIQRFRTPKTKGTLGAFILARQSAHDAVSEERRTDTTSPDDGFIVYSKLKKNIW